MPHLPTPSLPTISYTEISDLKLMEGYPQSLTQPSWGLQSVRSQFLKKPQPNPVVIPTPG
ncbi:rCG33419 [Rattus norvegicus]|uniref:RCG33419 n=1 Tax=Rattus norvegicus TaxID=10116 RepID=A6HEN1_RAT|nr:rCG33419 [Rattus norvegicus]